MLRAHHAVGAAVGFAQNDRDLRNGRFAVSEQQLGAVDDDAAVFLSGARQEARYVDERHDRNIERVAEPYEAGRFARGVDVEHAGQELRLVRDDADALSVEPGETGHDVRRELGLAFEKVAVVDDAPDYVQHVIGFVRIVRNDVVEHVVQPVDRVSAVHRGSVLHVVRRQEAEQLAQRGDALLFVFGDEMGYAALGRMDRRASELLLTHFLSGDGLDDFRSGHEHVARSLIHQNEVGQGGRVDRASRARTENGRNLRDHARGEDIALENLGVARQTVDTFLNARSARVVDADDRRAVLHRHVHYLAYFRSEGFGKRAAEYREVLREDVHLPSVDRAAPGHDAVAEIGLLAEPEVVAAMRDEHVEFLERALVE